MLHGTKRDKSRKGQGNHIKRPKVQRSSTLRIATGVQRSPSV